MLAVYLLLFLTACPCNLCLAWVILSHPQIRTIANVLVTSLAISDFLLGVFVVPSELLHYTFQDHEPKGFVCVVHQCVQIFVPLVSVAHLLIISIDRYVKIVHPLKYTNTATKSRLCIALFAIWLLPLLVSSLPVIGWNNYGVRNGTVFTDLTSNVTTCVEFETLPCPFQGIIFTFVCLTILIMVTIYLKIAMISSRQAKRIAVMTVAGNSRGNLLATEFKMAVVLAVTVGLFTISWLPLAAVTTHQCVSGQNTGQNYWTSAFIVAYLNSSINPLIYGIGNRDIRQTFLNSLNCKRLFRFRNQKRPEIRHNAMPFSVDTGAEVANNKDGPVSTIT